MSYHRLNFYEDKPPMYKEMRESMAKIYQNVDIKILGPVNVVDFSNKNTKIKTRT